LRIMLVGPLTALLCTGFGAALSCHCCPSCRLDADSAGAIFFPWSQGPYRYPFFWPRLSLSVLKHGILMLQTFSLPGCLQFTVVSAPFSSPSNHLFEHYLAGSTHDSLSIFLSHLPVFGQSCPLPPRPSRWIVQFFFRLHLGTRVPRSTLRDLFAGIATASVPPPVSSRDDEFTLLLSHLSYPNDILRTHFYLSHPIQAFGRLLADARLSDQWPLLFLGMNAFAFTFRALISLTHTLFGSAERCVGCFPTLMRF